MLSVVFTAVLLALSGTPVGEIRDTLRASEITADIKLSDKLSRQPVAYTEWNLRRLDRDHVQSVGDLSGLAPNFFQPRYGSHITSSIYFRGFGSRIDQPVVGVYVDDVPLLDKNAFDFEFQDLRSVQVLRGPQSVLFGRNTSLGVIRITTLSPFDWTGTRMTGEYASNGSWRLRLSHYARPSKRLGWSVAAGVTREGGYFVNDYTGERCDRGLSASLRGRAVFRGDAGWQWDNSLSLSILQEGGYAYGLYGPADGTLAPVNYNDFSGYRRLLLSDALSVRKRLAWADFSATASWQYLADRLDMDNDFTPRSYFSMVQQQREHGLTAEVLLRGRPEPGSRWRWMSGAFLFGRLLHLSSPVTFKQDGIRELILDNANAGIGKAFPGASLQISEQEFLIGSDFRIPAGGIALFHESSWELGRWTLTAGLRLEAEATAMHYDSEADIHYRFSLLMPDFEPFRTEFRGSGRQFFLVPVPKVAVSYSLDRGLLYATVQRGHKAGGFNTQLFSDILQNRMMDGMMRELGLSLRQGRYDSASATQYRPESTWNFELGAHLTPADGLRLSAALFWIECRDRQITVMAPGMSTGRMMANAAQARSVGAELSAAWEKGPWSLDFDYGHTRARSAGKYLPYAPQNTLSAGASYLLSWDRGWLDDLRFHVRYRGVGRIWWDEENTLSQPYYSLLSASVAARRGALTLTLWGENLTRTAYRTFWFRSIGREFFAQGAPLHFGLRVNYNF